MIFIPKMPSLGLLLEYPIFDGYNRKIATANDKLEPTDSDYRFPIDFEVHRAEIDLFKEQYIYSRMRTIEDKDALQVFFFPLLLYAWNSKAGTDLTHGCTAWTHTQGTT
jgi:tRNA pseudouridine38-40 synthase